MKILIIDDDKALAKSLQIQLSVHHDVEVLHTGQEGLTRMDEIDFELVLLDLTLPDLSGIDILQSIDFAAVESKVIVISGRDDMDSTIKAIQFGAFDFIRKPLDLDTVLLSLEKVKRELSQKSKLEEKTTAPTIATESQAETTSREIIGHHPSMVEIFKQIGYLSRNKVNVLIQGGSGSGKELVARALHKNGSAEAPFVPINCSAIVDNLLESELFGYEKGAFTGANERKLGKFEQAQSGVIFFDEIGEMSLNLQAKLLRVLQEREFERIGGSVSIPIQCRALFATHRNLKQMVAQGEFREDLYYRIAVGSIVIPELVDRKSDIPLLVQYLLGKLDKQYQIGKIKLNPEAIDYLQSQPWPGNIRQLENLLLRVSSMSTKEFLDQKDFQSIIEENSANSTSVHYSTMDTNLSLADMEKAYIQQVLQSKSWNITHSAASLNISPTTLRKKIKDYQLESLESD